MNPDQKDPTTAPRRPLRWVIGLGLLLVVVVLAWWFGFRSAPEDAALAPGASRQPSSLLGEVVPTPASPGEGATAPAPAGAGPLEVMAEKLANRLEAEPGDGEGWGLLARTYLELGDPARADAAYAKALALRPDDKRMQEDYAAAKAALVRPPQ